jgi:triosephosphate isomerase (TIM)
MMYERDMKHKKLIAGNWKMNGTLAEAKALVLALGQGSDKADICVCPPFIHLGMVAAHKSSSISLGAQECSSRDNGAFTGDISAAMLRDIGCSHVILGHSERRQHHKESSSNVADKAKKAHENGIITIICVGETESERVSGSQNIIVVEQLKESIPNTSNAQNLVIAYEPVWAIGTGKTATLEDIKDMHMVIRNFLQEKLDNSSAIRILYGGSVKADNAQEILAVPNVDGALVGGASLKSDQFLAIINAA